MFARCLMIAALALTMTGCGKTPTGLNSLTNSDGIIKVKAKVNEVDEEKFWADYPTQVGWVTIKSQKTDYMIVRLGARRLGFNEGSKIFFPVKVQGKVQFNSNLFLGKDKGLYISELGSGGTDYRFYRVGTFGARTLEFQEGDAIKVRLDPGFTLDVAINEGTKDEGPSLAAALQLKAMPTVVTHARLFTRDTAN
jgi:hypothetical protein